MRVLELGQVALAVDAFGDSRDPSVLLIAGATQSMDWWTPDFCQRLAAEGLHVVRYDHRDTGQSTSSPPHQPDYTGADLATDPIRILDALDIATAHLVGLSMGGGIAQYLGVNAPQRVRTLTLIESTPGGGDAGELPPAAPPASEADDAPAAVTDWSDAAAVLEYRVEAERPYAGSFGFDEARFRAVAAIEVGRTRSMESALTNHFLVAGDAGADPTAITQPTLVIHSDSDPLFALAHGRALARMIPGATLQRADGMGHEVPPPRTWDALMPVLGRHLGGQRAVSSPHGSGRAGPE